MPSSIFKKLSITSGATRSSFLLNWWDFPFEEMQKIIWICFFINISFLNCLRKRLKIRVEILRKTLQTRWREKNGGENEKENGKTLKSVFLFSSVEARTKMDLTIYLFLLSIFFYFFFPQRSQFFVSLVTKIQRTHHFLFE